MIYLTGSIIFTSFLAIGFKICNRLGIDTFQAIIFNYLTCVLTGSFVDRALPSYGEVTRTGWFPWALLMGLFFITFFNLTALTVKRNGVAVTSVATKLSLVIPFIFSLFLYNESAGIIKIAGIFLALIAVVLTCYSKDNDGGGRSWGRRLLLPGMVFLGTGLLDAIIKYTEQRYIVDETRDIFLITCFTVAFLTGLLAYIFRLATRKMKFEGRAVVAGICIGIPNYFSIWCLINALKKFPEGSSVIIPVNNMGIVFLSAIVAWIFFHERLSAVNLAGIILAMVSILMITSGI